MTLIDTSAWIEFFRHEGDRNVKGRVATLIDLDEAAHCGPVLFELLSGARPSEVSDIQEGLSFSAILEFPMACWERAATLENSLRTKGVTVPRDDILVAAAALHHGVAIYARDSHFGLMRDRGQVALRLI